MTYNDYAIDFREAFIRSGYFYEKTDWQFVHFAMKTDRDTERVVIVINNKLHDVKSKINLEFIREKLSHDMRIPQSMKVNYLTVVLNDSLDKAFRMKNCVVINWRNDSVKWYKTDPVFQEEEEIIKYLCKWQHIYDENYSIDTKPFEKQYPVIATYVLLVTTILMFILFNNKEGLGITKSMFETGQYYRLFTYMFVHGNLFHLIGNMVVLFYAGPLVESRMGSFKMVALYLASGVYGGYQAIMVPNANFTYTVGASGAIYGLLGAYVGYLIMKRSLHDKSYIMKVIGSVLVALVIGFMNPAINNRCHYMGFIMGICLCIIFNLCDNIEESQMNTSYRRLFNEHEKARWKI